MGKTILDTFCDYQKTRILSGKEAFKSIMENE